MAGNFPCKASATSTHASHAPVPDVPSMSRTFDVGSLAVQVHALPQPQYIFTNHVDTLSQ